MGDRHRLLICTIGSSPEPIIAAIRHSTPARVLLVPSANTKATALAITNEPGLLAPGQWDTVELHDAEDFADCVRRFRSLDGEIDAWQRKGPDYSVIVDFTGGTKCMSAALSAVARRWLCTFSYVGGTERTKGGTGIVVSGKEKTLVTQNPWNALGYQTIEEACLLFDQQAFASAARSLDEARRSADDDSIKRMLATFHQLCEGYGLWDRFQHKDACQRLDSVLKNVADLHAALGSHASEMVVRKIRDNRKTLHHLTDGSLSRAMITDLLANAERRGREGRYDDGVARLYRAIEAIGQLALDERHGIPRTDEVHLGRVPEPLREEWQSRAKDGILLLGLKNVYELLDALADESGRKFLDLGLGDRKISPLAARNHSILAHGFQPVGEGLFRELREAAMRLGGFAEEDLPEFPRLTKGAKGQ